MNERFLQNITDFVFTQDEPQKSDVIFIPGNRYPQMAKRAAELWKEGFAPIAVPSGKYSIMAGRFEGCLCDENLYCGDYATEADFLADVLYLNGVRPEAILKEREATFTYENAVFSRQLLESRGIVPRRAIICCQAYHARRCRMYYQLVFPETEFFICPSDTGINRENWYLDEKKAVMVLGEMERCGSQFAMIWEDIADQECRPLTMTEYLERRKKRLGK